MEKGKAVILCNNRFAIPLVRELQFYDQLGAVLIPRKNLELEEELRMSLPDPRFLCTTGRKDLPDNIKKVFNETAAICALVLSFPYKIPPELLSLAPRGFFNFHFGALPQYRGPEPLFAQMKNGEPFAVLSVHELTEEMDAGPICIEERIAIGPTDSYGVVQAKLAWASTGLALQLMKQFEFTERIPSRTQDPRKAGWYAKPVLKDVLIDWERMDAGAIRNLVNACNPWNKGAGTRLGQQMIALLEVEITDEEYPKNMAAGTIVSLNSRGLFVATQDKKILRVNVLYTPEGFMSGGRLAGYGIKAGDRFS